MEESEDLNAKIEIYLKEILDFNKRFNLVSNKEANLESLRLHVKDSLQGFEFIENLEGEVLDIGSGVGFPGIVLAIIDKKRKYYLLERSSKKAMFLKYIAKKLELKVEILNIELENLDKKFKIIVLRAFRELEDYLKIFYEKLEFGGTIVFYKGRQDKVKTEENLLREVFREVRVEKRNLEGKERHFLVCIK